MFDQALRIALCDHRIVYAKVLKDIDILRIACRLTISPMAPAI